MIGSIIHPSPLTRLKLLRQGNCSRGIKHRQLNRSHSLKSMCRRLLKHVILMTSISVIGQPINDRQVSLVSAVKTLAELPGNPTSYLDTGSLSEWRCVNRLRVLMPASVARVLSERSSFLRLCNTVASVDQDPEHQGLQHTPCKPLSSWLGRPVPAAVSKQLDLKLLSSKD